MPEKKTAQEDSDSEDDDYVPPVEGLFSIWTRYMDLNFYNA